MMGDTWYMLLALAAIVAPLWLAWALLGRKERRKNPGSGTPSQRKP